MRIHRVHADRTTPGASCDFFEAVVLSNLRAGVDLLLTQAPRTRGIEERDDDPVYENLYNRFYAIMSDGAALEHLAVAAQVDSDPRLRIAGAQTLQALTQAWSFEASRTVGYGNAYALTRLLKSLSLGFAAFGPDLAHPVHDKVSAFLLDLAGLLWNGWFSRADVRGRTGIAPGLHSPHHASVEWSGFGVAALVISEGDETAAGWVDAVVEHFDRELLPRALAVDGAPPEGRDFWLSTMFSRVQFLEALHNVTGLDLADRHPACARTDLAEVLFRRTPPLQADEYGEDRLPLDDWRLLPRGAGAVLLWLADRTGDPRLQALGMLDSRAGSLESMNFALPRTGTRLRMASSSYAALWMSTAVTPASELAPQAAAFPSIALCATSRGWRRGAGFSAAIDEGRVLVWAGDELVLEDLSPKAEVDLAASRDAGTGIFHYEPIELFGEKVSAAQIHGGDLLETRNADDEVTARVFVSADASRVRVERRLAPEHRWRTSMRWEVASAPADGIRLKGSSSSVMAYLAGGTLGPARPVLSEMAVGYGLLKCDGDGTERDRHDHDLYATTEQRWVRVDFTLEPLAVTNEGWTW